ncbi:MAG TPA: LysR substrate-binding domain-containing protein [Chroococcales cyanobacterium]|jgi:DNA-binding transcriptional LysR family regulator
MLRSVGIYLLPAIVAKYQALHPFTKIGLAIGNTEAIIDGLLHGNLDLAVIDAQLTSLRSFHCEFLLEEKLVLAAAPNHPLLREATLTADRLYEVPLIMRKNASRTRRQLEIELAKAGFDLQRLKVVYEFDNNEAIKQAITAGLGCGFLPLEVLEQSLRWGEIGIVKGLGLRRKLWLYSKCGEGLGLVQAFNRFLVQEVAA